MVKKLILFICAVLMIVANSISSFAYGISRTACTLAVGNQIQLIAYDDKGESLSGTWKSSNSKVASVDSEGTITAVNTGYTVVTFTDADGLTMKCEVNVTLGRLPEKTEKTYIVQDKESGDLYGSNVIHSGTYSVTATGDGAVCTVYGDNGQLGFDYSSDVSTNVIVNLKDGQTVWTRQCSLSSTDKVTNTLGKGQYIVGQQIPAGSYRIETDNADSGTYVVYDNVNREHDINSNIVTQRESSTVTLEDGQLIELNSTKLVE